MSLKPGLGRGDAGNRHLHVGVEQVLDHHHRVVALLDRLGIEERGQARKGLGVVIDGVGDVLLRSGELVCDLLVQALDEPRCGHRSSSLGGRARTGRIGPAIVLTGAPSAEGPQ